MKPLVLDASATLAIVLDTGGSDRLVAHTADHSTVAPDLLATEVTNGLWKYVRRGDLSIDLALDRLREALSLVDIWWPSLDLAPQALRIATFTHHPVYDTTYLALAERVGATTILTLDRRLGALATSAGLKAVP